MEFFFVEEDFLEEFSSAIRADVIDGVILASGCMQSVTIREALNGPMLREELHRAYERKVGFCLLHQALQVGSKYHCDFLPQPFQIEISRGEPKILKGQVESDKIRLGISKSATSVTDLDDLAIDSVGNEAQIWTSFAPDHPDCWRTRVWCKNDKDGERIDLIGTASSIGPSIITSSLALDWNGRIEPLASLAARCARARATVAYISSSNNSHDSLMYPYLHSEAIRGRPVCLANVDTADQWRLDGFYFGKEVFSPAWRLWNIPDWSKKKLMSRLENGGSIAAFVDGPRWRDKTGGETLVEVSGPMQYVARAQWYAEWLLHRRSLLTGGFTFDTRAVAVACAMVNRTFADRAAVPVGLQLSEIRPLIERAVLDRLAGRDNCDNMLIPTAACAHALILAGSGLRAAPLIAWLRRALSDSARPKIWLEDQHAIGEAQARLWIEDLQSVDSLQSWVDRYYKSDAIPPHLRKAMFIRLALLSRKIPDQQDVGSLIDMVSHRELGPVIQSEICYFLIENCLEQSIGKLIEESYCLVEELHSLANANGGIEAVSLLVAALVGLEAEQPPLIMRRESAVNSVTQAAMTLVPLEQEVSRLQRNLADTTAQVTQAQESRKKWRRVSQAWALSALAMFICADASVSALIVVEHILTVDVMVTIALAAMSSVAIVVGIARWYQAFPWEAKTPISEDNLM